MSRQGDVLLDPIDRFDLAIACAIRPDAGRLALDHGEATGHAHAVSSDDATLWETPREHCDRAGVPGRHRADGV